MMGTMMMEMDVVEIVMLKKGTLAQVDLPKIRITALCSLKTM